MPYDGSYEGQEFFKRHSGLTEAHKESLRKVDDTLQYISSGSEKVLTTSFKDRFLENLSQSQTFLSAQSPQSMADAIIVVLERELEQSRVHENTASMLRRQFILAYMSAKQSKG